MQNQNPALGVTVDKASISTELLTSNMVTVKLASTGGFSGPVTLAASAVDAAGSPIPGWTVTLDKATVDVAANGTTTAVATVKVPSDSAALAGTVKIDATSSVGASNVTSTVTVAKQLSITLTLNGANCVYPERTLGTVKVAQGTKIRWVNGDAANNITIHVNGGIAGLVHQPGATPPNGAYEQVVNAASGTSNDWYCHNRNDPAQAGLPTSNLTAVP